MQVCTCARPELLLLLPGDAGRGPIRAAGSLGAVSAVIEGPEGPRAVGRWRGPSGSWTLA